jgi:hypothetical protein
MHRPRTRVIPNSQRELLASPPLSGSVTALLRVVGSPIGQKCRILRNLNQVSLYPLWDHTDNEPIASTVGIFHKRPERHRDVTGGLRVLFVGRGPSGRGGDELKDAVVLHASTVPARSTRSVLRNEQLARQRNKDLASELILQMGKPGHVGQPQPGGSEAGTSGRNWYRAGGTNVTRWVQNCPRR